MSLVNTETGEIDCTLSAVEAEVLASAETVIERGLSSFLDVGDALAQVRDDKLYRADYRTFEEYCDERWDLKRQRAYQLMAAAEVAGTLSQISDTVPERESHAAALAPLRDEPEAMARAAEAAAAAAADQDRKPTAADYAAAVAVETGTNVPTSPEGEPDTPPSALPPVAEQDEVPAPRPAPPHLVKSEADIAFEAVSRLSKAAAAFLGSATVERMTQVPVEDWDSFQSIVETLTTCNARIVEGGRSRRRLHAIEGERK